MLFEFAFSLKRHAEWKFEGPPGRAALRILLFSYPCRATTIRNLERTGCEAHRCASREVSCARMATPRRQLRVSFPCDVC